MDFFNDMPSLLQTYWYIAIPSSLIFLVQFIMTFIGADSGDGIEADFDSDLSGEDAPFQLFSFRNLINFLLGFSWTGISFYSSIESPTILILLSILIGAAFIYLFFIIIKQLMKLSENNSFTINECIGKSAEVYLTIPANKQGKGKVLVSVRGSVKELEAITNANTSAQTGSVVKIIGIENNQYLIVE